MANNSVGITNVVTVKTPGPQGPVGPQGPGFSSGSMILTGSLSTSGSYIDFTSATGVSGSFSGSYTGDGSNLTGVTAEWDGTHVGNAQITGSLSLSGSLIPNGSGSYDLGSESHPWKEIYVMSSSIKFMKPDAGVVATLGVDSDGDFDFGTSALIMSGSQRVSGSFSVTASHGQTDSLMDIAGHLQIESSGIVSMSKGLYVTKSDAAGDQALLDVAGHLMIDSSGIVRSTSNDTQITGSLLASGSKHDIKGDVSIGSTLYVAGAAVISGSLTVSGSNVDFINSTGVSGSFSGSFAGDGSGLTNIPASGIDGQLGIFAQTSSVQSTHNNLVITGSIIMSGSGDISGSITSTASFGHFIGNGSGLTNVFEGTTASSSISTRLTTNTTNITALSAESSTNSTNIAANASGITSLTGVTGSYVTTGSGATQTIQGGLTLTGTLTAHQYIVSTSVYNVTMSYSSGSHKFGDSADDIQEFTGSVSISGSFYVTGSSQFIGPVTAFGNVSSSITSTGSFGHVKTNKITAGSLTTTGGISATSLTASANLSVKHIQIVNSEENVVIGNADMVAATNYTAGAVRIGWYAGWQQDNNGDGSILIGRLAGAYNTTPDNVAIGRNAIAVGNGGDAKIGIGASALYNCAGSYNIGLGYKAGYQLTSGVSNIIIGHYAASASAAAMSSTLFIGSGSLAVISGSLTTGDTKFTATATASFGKVSATTYVGDGSQLTGISAGFWTGSDAKISREGSVDISGSLTISGSLIATGAVSASAFSGSSYTGTTLNITKTLLTPGDSNSSVYIGTGAGADGLAVQKNVCIGVGAHQNNTAGDKTVAIGYRASYGGDGSEKSVFIGAYAGYNANSSQQTVAIGEHALQSAGGSYNVVIGYYAGYNVASTGNTLLGHYAGNVLTDGAGNIFIGSGSLGAAGMANQLRIGNGQTTHIISGSLVTGDVIFPASASAVTMVAKEFSGSTYYGDGSNLTGLGGGGIFIATGSSYTTANHLQITGSLIVSSSAASQSLSLIGSGSTIFDVQGAAGTLFSVDDGLSGELFAANDASGLSIISAHADRTVKLGKPGGFGIVISGSNPMPTDAAARIEISGSTYFSGTVADFTDVGTVKATTFSGSFTGNGSLLTGVPGASGLLSGSAQIASEISGAFQTAGVLSGSAQIAANISGSVKNPSVGISGSFSGSFEGDGSNLTGISAGSSIDTGSLGNTIITGSLTVTGHIAGATKSFLIDHPIKPGYKLQYGVLEGPEHGVYVRGQLTNENNN